MYCWYKTKHVTAVKKPPIIELKEGLKSRAVRDTVETLKAKKLFMSGNYDREVLSSTMCNKAP